MEQSTSKNATIAQPVNKLPVLLGTRQFITIVPRDRYWTLLSWNSPRHLISFL